MSTSGLVRPSSAKIVSAKRIAQSAKILRHENIALYGISGAGVGHDHVRAAFADSAVVFSILFTLEILAALLGHSGQ